MQRSLNGFRFERVTPQRPPLLGPDITSSPHRRNHPPRTLTAPGKKQMSKHRTRAERRVTTTARGSRHQSGPFLHNATRAQRETIILEAPVRTATRTSGPLQASARVALQHLAGTHRTHALLKAHAHRVANHGTFRLVGGFTRNEHSQESPLFSSLTDKRDAGTLTASIHHVEFHNQCRTTCQPHPDPLGQGDSPYQPRRRTKISLMDPVCGRGAPRIAIRCAFVARVCAQRRVHHGRSVQRKHAEGSEQSRTSFTQRVATRRVVARPRDGSRAHERRPRPRSVPRTRDTSESLDVWSVRSARIRTHRAPNR